MKRLALYVCCRKLLRCSGQRIIASSANYATGPYPSFKCDDMQISLHIDYGLKMIPELENLAFGKTYSDHMFEVEWTEKQGWGAPRIVPIHFFQMHPGAKILHYAQGVFEGMKAFKYSDDTVALFRPELNISRLLASAHRACLPPFDTYELLKCMKKLVSIDRAWVPSQPMSSLYIRPTFIGVENNLGVASANKALLYIVTCPVGPYFTSGIKPVSLLADPKYVRASPGGVGNFKMASNYAPSLLVQRLAQKQGFDQVLWLFGKDHQVTEAGAMNAFFFIKKNENLFELVTPALDGTILPGVVRQSILELSRQWQQFDISERPITISEVAAASKEKRLLEMFICGTACSVCPVKSIHFEGEDIAIPTLDSEHQLYQRFLQALSDIQYGTTKSSWSVRIED